MKIDKLKANCLQTKEYSKTHLFYVVKCLVERDTEDMADQLTRILNTGCDLFGMKECVCVQQIDAFIAPRLAIDRQYFLKSKLFW